jgi:hypothetical protein
MRKLAGELKTILVFGHVLCLAFGCSTTPESSNAVDRGRGNNGDHDASTGPKATGTGGSGGPGINLPDGGTTDAGNGVCASVTQRAQRTREPVDIIFMIDNSESMADKIASVRQRINKDFVDIISASGVDYRVIMLSRYGKTDDNMVCIPAPLGGTDCSSPDSQPLKNGARYFQYSVEIASLDGWCKMIDSFSRPDEFDYTDYYPSVPQRRPWTPLAPTGWREYLRPKTFKSFVLITDDDLTCNTFADNPDLDVKPRAYDAFYADAHAAAAKFDATLLKMAPEFFGTKDKRNYRVHSIVGLDAKGTVPATEPLITGTCGTSDGAGLGHQALSMLTGGLRYPICRYDDYREVFNTLATDTIETAQLSCDWAIPPPPTETVFDSTKVNVEYKPGNGAASEVLPNVASEGDCGSGDGWFYNDNAAPTRINACPKTCTALKADPAGTVDIAFGCTTIVRVK